MKKVHLLLATAATFLFAVGVASAQDLKKDEHPTPAPAAQQNAPAEKIAPNMHAGERKAPETTGQGAAAGAAKLSTEQRTKINTIIREQKSPPEHLNVTVAVGTRVPATVHLYPMPVEVVQIYPEWRGYDYIMVGDEIVVIDPGSHEIVAIIEV